MGEAASVPGLPRLATSARGQLLSARSSRLMKELQRVNEENSEQEAQLLGLRTTLQEVSRHATAMSQLQSLNSPRPCSSQAINSHPTVQSPRPCSSQAINSHSTVQRPVLSVLCEGEARAAEARNLPSSSQSCRIEANAFIGAAGSDDLRVVQKAINEGIDVNVVDCQKQSALHKASANGNAAVVLFLLQAGADVHMRDDRKWTPLHCAAHRGWSTVIHSLVKSQAEIEALEESGNTPLLLAVLHGHLDAVQYLVGAGADASTSDWGGHSPLQVASERGHSHIVSFLRARQGRNVKSN